MEGKPLAKCPLKDIKDTDNYLFLTEKQLVVKVNGKLNTYDVEAITLLHWKTKKLLLPIVAGGLSSSLSVFAYMNDLLHPWIMLLLFIVGVLMLYYGFTGTPALILNFKNSEDQYLLRSTTVYLEHFIKFFNKYISTRSLPKYYMIISNHQWQKAQEDGFIQANKPIRLMEDINKTTTDVLLKVSIEAEQIKIVYLPTGENNELKPCVTDNVPLSAVSKV